MTSDRGWCGGLLALSYLSRLELRDARGRHASLRDLVAQLNSDSPAITALVVHDGERLREAAPDGLQVLADGSGLRVDDLSRAPSDSMGTSCRAVRLVGDVLDKLVLDLTRRGPARVNDLLLGVEDDTLRLKAVDATARGISRRLTGGRWPAVSEDGLVDWRYVVFLHGLSRSSADNSTCRRIARLPVGEIARLTNALPYLHAAELLGFLPPRVAAEVLEVLPGPRQLQVFEELDDGYASQLLAVLAPDTAADLLARLDPEAARDRLRHLPDGRRRLVAELLQYPENTVGAAMTNDMVLLPRTATVAEAYPLLQRSLASPSFVYYAYVVDTLDSRRLCGMVTLRQLLTADGTAVLHDIMHPYLAVLDPLSALNPACQEVIDYRVQALPVVDSGGRFLGILTADKALAHIVPASWRTRTRHVFS